MDLATLERERLRAIVEVDPAVLHAMHDDEFALCNPSGTIWNKATYIGGLCDGSINYLRFEPTTPINVLRNGNLAVLRYRSSIDVITPAGGGRLECWHLDVYVRGEDRAWRCRWSHATDTIG